MYLLKNKEMDKLFVERSAVVKAVDPVTMLKHLGVNKKYIISDNFKFTNSDQDYEYSEEEHVKESIESAHSESDESDLSHSRELAKQNHISQIPYFESIKALERISKF